MAKPPYLEGLHRPFHQQLKTVRWVCEFIERNQQPVKSSKINVQFYFYLINFLYNKYNRLKVDDIAGLPSRKAIVSVYNFFKNEKYKDEILQTILKTDRLMEVDKQVYSTYKAASYYINMTKHKLNLIDNENFLTSDGIELLKIKSKFIKYNKQEKFFFFKKLLSKDFLLFVANFSFKKTSNKYNIQEYNTLIINFINIYYDVKSFNYISQSSFNYNIVRECWIENLEILDKRLNLKKEYLYIIENDKQYSGWYKDFLEKSLDYENIYIKRNSIYEKNRLKFEERYNECMMNKLSDIGFVNLYDIKEIMKMSNPSFEKFINQYYENEKGKKSIFFSNIVNSIDRRQRFKVRNTPVLKIKIK